MKTITIEIEAYEKMLRRSQIFEAIEEVMQQAYPIDENGNMIDTDEDIASIGEKVCTIMGYM